VDNHIFDPNMTSLKSLPEIISKLDALGFSVFAIKEIGTGLTKSTVLSTNLFELKRAEKAGGAAAALVSEALEGLHQPNKFTTVDLIRRFANRLTRSAEGYEVRRWRINGTLTSLSQCEVDSAAWYGDSIDLSLDLVDDALKHGRVDEAINEAIRAGICAERARWKFSIEKDALDGARQRDGRARGNSISATGNRERGRRSKKASIEAAKNFAKKPEARYWKKADYAKEIEKLELDDHSKGDGYIKLGAIMKHLREFDPKSVDN
jgi:hypothetical protein